MKPPRVKRGAYILEEDAMSLGRLALANHVKPSQVLDEAIRREVRRLLKKENRHRKATIRRQAE